MPDAISFCIEENLATPLSLTHTLPPPSLSLTRFHLHRISQMRSWMQLLKLLTSVTTSISLLRVVAVVSWKP
jgi:hypothetical protein